MPYIEIGRRKELNTITLGQLKPENAGELNYCFTRIIRNYIEHKGEKYQHYNDIMGALLGALLEDYRRQTTPYEDQAIKRNGDLQ